MPYAPKWEQLEKETERECLVGYKDVYFYELSANINLLAFTVKGSNFNELERRGLHEKHEVATWKFGTISVFP
jgi:hypothetical protein